MTQPDNIQKLTPEDLKKLREWAKIPTEGVAIHGAFAGADPGYCGLGVETGPRDPWWKRMCQRHDRAFNELKAGTYEGSGMKVAARAAADVAGGVAAGVYLIVSSPLYFAGAVIGGLFRWGYLERKLNRKKDWIP